MIESYAFGRMSIKGKVYTSDLIIYPEKIDPSWWRQSGHVLCLEDIRDVLNEQPEVLIIGTGFMGLMKITEEVREYTDKNNIELIIQTSKKAVRTFNDLAPKKRTIGAFHLTC
jgi:hypothetical protein